LFQGERPLSCNNRRSPGEFSSPAHLKKYKRNLLIGVFERQTEPDSFSLKIYLNYQTIVDGKPKATNALITSALHYSGEMLDHQLGIGEQVIKIKIRSSGWLR
jgi:hypothetical protein